MRQAGTFTFRSAAATRGVWAYPEFRDRYLGYADAPAAAGVRPDLGLYIGALSGGEEGARAARALLAAGAPFDGVVAASDLIALAAIGVFDAAGLRVPGDVLVVGFGDIPAASLANPPLTTVVQDAGAAGRALVETLLGRIRDRPVASRTLPTRLVVRRLTEERS